MSRFRLLTILVVGFLITQSFSATADSPVADCISLRNPTSSSSPTLITLRVDVYATCNSIQLGRGNGQRALYEMPQEESLINLDSCSGPSVAPLIGNGWLGTATCSLRVGSNTLPSPRTGATSTEIKVWFAWDFSTKSISVTHGAIPAGTNNGRGGSSGGSSTPAPTPVQSCAPPAIPKLTYVYNDKGVLFSASPATTGTPATSLLWSFAHYDIAGSVWGPWTKWTIISPAKEFTYQADNTEGKSRIVFSVYASNACGDSEQARESESHTGILFVPISTARFINIQAGTSNSNVRANGTVLPEFKIQVTDNLGKGIPNFQLEIVLSGVGRLMSDTTKSTVTTDSNGESVIQIKSEIAGQSSITVKAVSVGQFAEPAGIVGGVATPGAKPGTYSATANVTFKISESEELINNEAKDAANEAIAAADIAAIDDESTNSVVNAAKNAADQVIALALSTDKLIANLKAQIIALTKLVAKIQSRLDA